MKRVFSNHNEVLHRWANQTQDSARSSNVFFEGKSVYSYGYHYELGRLITYSGQTVALINDTGYSVTTSKHIRNAEGAVSHLIMFNTDGSFDLEGAIVRTQNRLIDALSSMITQRYSWSEGLFKKDEYGDKHWTIMAIEKFNGKLEKLGSFKKYRIPLESEFFLVLNELTKIQFSKAQARTEKQEAAREQKRKDAEAKRAERLEAWLLGGDADVYGLRPQRLRIKGDKLETSDGVSVDKNAAARFLKGVLNKSIKVGTKIEGFKLNKITKKELGIGCHTISIEEAEHVLLYRPDAAKLTLVKG